LTPLGIHQRSLSGFDPEWNRRVEGYSMLVAVFDFVPIKSIGTALRLTLSFFGCGEKDQKAPIRIGTDTD
jgi:hypothetical protein